MKLIYKLVLLALLGMTLTACKKDTVKPEDPTDKPEVIETNLLPYSKPSHGRLNPPRIALAIETRTVRSGG